MPQPLLAYLPRMRTRQRSSLVIAAVAALAVAGCTVARPTGTPAASGAGQATTAPSSPAPSGAPSSPEPTIDTSGLDVERIAITLDPFATVPGDPLAIATPDDGSGRLFVATRDARIWVVEADGTVAATPMINLEDSIQSGGEQGLLGIAAHPSFPSDPRVFIGYTNNGGDDVVASLRLDEGDPNRLDPESLEPILVVDDFAGNHNGGAVLFGPDGYLYAFLGDGGGGGDPQENGQDLDALLGKILRLDIDNATGDEGYAIPPDNPFVGRNGADEIWHWGVRNPWRASFDRATGDLWFGDVGQGSWEEIDVSPAGLGGLNYGWNVMEGAHCYGGDGCDRDDLTLPVTEYGRDLGYTVIGGYVYRGEAYPFLRGAYLFSDYGTGLIFAIDAATRDLVDPVQVGSGNGGMSAFGEDADGELYITNLDGSILKVVATQT